MANGDHLLPTPDQARTLSLETQVAVLYERVTNMGDEMRSIKRALWSFVATVISGSILFLVSIAAGWFGPAKTAAGVAVGWLF